MSQEESQNLTDLVLVRQIRNLIDTLDAHVGELIKDEEHAQARRIVREWERRLDATIKIRKERADKKKAEGVGL